MTVVLVLGEIPSMVNTGYPSAIRVPVGAAGLSSAMQILEQARPGLTEHQAVLALYPAWRPDGAKSSIRFARSMLSTDRIVPIPVRLPPLAFSLVADQLAFLAPYVGAGMLVALADQLCKDVFAGAWVNSVARLEHVKTGMVEHLSSYLPGSGFVVSATQRSGIHRITSAEPMMPDPFRPPAPIQVLAAHGSGDLAWLQSKFGPALGAASVSIVGAQPLSPIFWGTEKYVEFVVFSGHPEAVRARAASIRCTPCGWCGEPIASPVCSFCCMRQRALQVEGPPHQDALPAS
ncbi:hypothetical protein ACRYCC_12065 [Actinomadura scrupuli]|uniref:hypothetical protein n=1 Tax=Actinomadura scrupuli TaxID=559629 RepID=UPI003D99A50F